MKTSQASSAHPRCSRRQRKQLGALVAMGGAVAIAAVCSAFRDRQRKRKGWFSRERDPSWKRLPADCRPEPFVPSDFAPPVPPATPAPPSATATGARARLGEKGRGKGRGSQKEKQEMEQEGKLKGSDVSELKRVLSDDLSAVVSELRQLERRFSAAVERGKAALQLEAGGEGTVGKTEKKEGKPERRGGEEKAMERKEERRRRNREKRRKKQKRRKEWKKEHARAT